MSDFMMVVGYCVVVALCIVGVIALGFLIFEPTPSAPKPPRCSNSTGEHAWGQWKPVAGNNAQRRTCDVCGLTEARGI